MSNIFYIPDDEQSYMQAQIEQEQQEFELQQKEEYQQYLNVLARGENYERT